MRIEKDFLGAKELPDTAYYGVQTLRGKENFHITGVPMSLEPNFVKAFACDRLIPARCATSSSPTSFRAAPGRRPT
jgi:aspartate ammonia-lyase